jgi:hypothetical protein
MIFYQIIYFRVQINIAIYKRDKRQHILVLPHEFCVVEGLGDLNLVNGDRRVKSIAIWFINLEAREPTTHHAHFAWSFAFELGALACFAIAGLSGLGITTSTTGVFCEEPLGKSSYGASLFSGAVATCVLSIRVNVCL